MKPPASAIFPNLRVAAEFYGFRERRFKMLVAIGRVAGDPLPHDVPAEMPQWWERMMDAGRIVYACPAGIIDRVGANPADIVVPAPEKKTTRPPKARKRAASAAKSAPKPAKVTELPKAVPPAPVELYDGVEVTGDEILGYEKQLFATVHREYMAEVAKTGLLSTTSRDLARRRQEILSSLQAMQKSVENFRAAGEWMRRSEVNAGAQQFATGLIQCLRVELPHEFPRNEHERILAALDRIAAKWPEINPFTQKTA